MLECAVFAAAIVMQYVSYEQARPSDHNHDQASAVVRVYTEQTAEVMQYCSFGLQMLFSTKPTCPDALVVSTRRQLCSGQGRHKGCRGNEWDNYSMLMVLCA